MKNIFLVLSALLLVLSTNANPPISVSSKIESVTVFLSGAEIVRTGSKTLTEGRYELVFEDLSETIDPSSIQANGKGNFTILSVSHRFNYMKDRVKSPQIKALEDSLEFLQHNLELNKGMEEVYKEEKNLILANKSIKGQDQTLMMEDLEDIADFYRRRLPEINKKSLELRKKDKKLQERIAKINKQLGELNAKFNRNSSEIVVEVAANKSTTATMEISYMVRQAGWVPAYDIRAKNTTDPVTMSFKGQVFQNTGVDWENIELTLSTTNPTISGNKPQLSKWELRIIDPVVYQRPATLGVRNLPGRAPSMSKSEVQGSIAADRYEEPEAESIADYTTINTSPMNVEYDIKLPYSVPSDGKHHIVQMHSASLPAVYRHYAAPKLNQDAFLLAKITGWENLNLLAGEANIFFERSYVGQTFINPKITKDTMDLSLGVDKNVVIERNRIKSYTEKKLLGSQIKESFGIEITVRNTKSTGIEIEIVDQIPVTTNKDIEVELVDKGGAQLDENKGFLKWNTEIQPAQVKTFVFRYSVKYPKDKIINL